METLKNLGLTGLIALFLTSLTWADSNSTIRNISPNHTEITLRDESPEAYHRNRIRAEKAQARLELKRERAHQLELAKIKAQSELQAQKIAAQKYTPPRRSNRQDRPAFFNGGVYTGFHNLGYGGFGYGYGNYGRGYGYGNYRYNGYRGYRRGYRGSRRGFRRYRGGYRGGFRGRGRSFRRGR